MTKIIISNTCTYLTHIVMKLYSLINPPTISVCGSKFPLLNAITVTLINEIIITLVKNWAKMLNHPMLNPPDSKLMQHKNRLTVRKLIFMTLFQVSEKSAFYLRVLCLPNSVSEIL